MSIKYSKEEIDKFRDSFIDSINNCSVKILEESFVALVNFALGYQECDVKTRVGISLDQEVDNKQISQLNITINIEKPNENN